MLLLALFAVVATAVFNGKPIGFDPPYLVRVAGDCTGSVLSSRYVLTAAVKEEEEEEKKIDILFFFFFFFFFFFYFVLFCF